MQLVNAMLVNAVVRRHVVTIVDTVHVWCVLCCNYLCDDDVAN